MVNKEQNFEASFKRLNQIVEELESGSVALDHSLSLFEEGMKLVTLARGQLTEAEERVKTLIKTEEGFEEKPGVN